MNLFASLAMPSLNQVVIAILILIGARLVSALIMSVLRHSKQFTSKTDSTLDDEIVALFARPIHVLFQIAGILVALYYLFPTLSYATYGYGDVALVLLFLWGAYAGNRLIRGLLRWHESETETGEKRRTFGFLETMISVLVWGMMIAFALNYFGVNISALLAGLGIAGVAVALALKDTLSGLFAAVFLVIDKPIRQGDFVELEGGTEGFIEDISMRSTRVRTFDNNIVIVPNNRLSSMIIKNFHLGSRHVRFVVPVGVGYGSDLDQVEKLILEVAADTYAKVGITAPEEASVRFTGFGDSAMTIDVRMHVENFPDQVSVKHDFIKALYKAFEQKNIDIPYPQMTVHVNSTSNK